MGKNYVILESGTIGFVVDGTPEIGSVVTVSLSDENGNDITEDGVVSEIV